MYIDYIVFGAWTLMIGQQTVKAFWLCNVRLYIIQKVYFLWIRLSLE